MFIIIITTMQSLCAVSYLKALQIPEELKCFGVKARNQRFFAVKTRHGNDLLLS
jgi:hypothetical protein